MAQVPAVPACLFGCAHAKPFWSTRLLPEIGDALGRDINGPMPFFHTLGRRAIAVETARSQPADFLNINTPGDLAAALQHVEPAHQSGQV